MKDKKNGFTILEFLIVMVIIVILSSALFMGRREGEERLSLQSSIFQLAQDIRETQEMAMGAKEVSCQNGSRSYSYGIYFNSHDLPNSYIIFADCNNNTIKDSADKVIRKVNMARKTKIYSLSANPLSIVFYPPNPTVYINGVSGGRANAVITMSTVSDQFNPKNREKVEINPIGVIEID